MRLIFLGTLAVVALISPAMGQDRCRDILANGVWEYRADMSDTRLVRSFLNWYGSTESGGSSSNKRQSFTAGGAYGVYSGELGLSGDEQRNQEFFSKLEKLNTGYEQYDSRIVNFVKTASAVIVKAWTDCMAGAAGIGVSLTFTENPRDMFVDLRYRPINPGPNPSVTITAPSSVSCELPRNHKISVPEAGVVVRCMRKVGEAGAITLASATVIFPDKTLRFPTAVIRQDLTGKSYATCDVFEDIKTGNDTLGEPETLPNSGDDMGGGKPSTSVALEAPIGYHLTNVKAHCTPLDKPDACRFVRAGDNSDIQWTIPNRKAELHPTTDGPRVTVFLSGTKQKVIEGMERRKHPASLPLTYGKNFSVEFPTSAADVKLYCNASGAQRIYSLSAIQQEGDQIYLRAVRQTSTGKIMDMAVLPFEFTQ
jgi:hypothetical protein